MGSRCSHNATGAIHALRVGAKRKPTHSSFFTKLNCLYLQHKCKKNQKNIRTFCRRMSAFDFLFDSSLHKNSHHYFAPPRLISSCRNTQILPPPSPSNRDGQERAGGSTEESEDGNEVAEGLRSISAGPLYLHSVSRSHDIPRLRGLPSITGTESQARQVPGV